jgi:hypothetical protein
MCGGAREQHSCLQNEEQVFVSKQVDLAVGAYKQWRECQVEFGSFPALRLKFVAQLLNSFIINLAHP